MAWCVAYSAWCVAYSAWVKSKIEHHFVPFPSLGSERVVKLRPTHRVPTLWGQTMDHSENKPVVGDAINVKQDDFIYHIKSPSMNLIKDGITSPLIQFR